MEKLYISSKQIGYKLIIAGDGPSTESLVSKYPDIDYRGSFTQSDLPKLMKEISVMYAVYPPDRLNIKEGALSVKMLDAASFGIPSVVSKGNPMTDFCEKHKLGVSVDYNDIDSICKGIILASDLEVNCNLSEDKDAFQQLILDMRI